MADRLAAILGRLGLPLSQARALDLVARISGLPDWDRMRAGLVRLEGAQVPAADYAITRILRLDAEDPALTVRAVEAVWDVHLTEHERADPALGRARDWLRLAVSGAHAWSRAHRSPLTPDQLCAALEAGTGQQIIANRNRTGAILPRLVDLHVWASLDRIAASWVSDLDAHLRATPGFDPARALAGRPQPDMFRRAAEDRMRLTLPPLRDLINEVRNEPDSS
jgi:hypothetical protein